MRAHHHRPRARALAHPLLLALLLGGCASPTPEYDSRFGLAVRHNRQAQVIDAQAGKREDLVLGLDGRSAQEAMRRYQDSFKVPPPVINVIQIGQGAAGR